MDFWFAQLSPVYPWKHLHVPSSWQRPRSEHSTFSLVPSACHVIEPEPTPTLAERESAASSLRMMKPLLEPTFVSVTSLWYWADLTTVLTDEVVPSTVNEMRSSETRLVVSLKSWSPTVMMFETWVIL